MVTLAPNGGTVMADPPNLVITNGFTREQDWLQGEWNTNDTYNQSYSVDWSEAFSSRLAVDLQFKVDLEDTIRQLDVDDKRVTPSVKFGIRNPVWDMNLSVTDTIEYSNEFNNPRSDEIEYGVDFNLFIEYFPPFKLNLQKLLDKQDNLSDLSEVKVDASSDYNFGEFFAVTLSWKENETDDRLFDNNDIESHDWLFDFTYSQALNSAIKIDYKSKASGGSNDTFNNAGALLLAERNKEYSNKLKLTLSSFPDLESNIELDSEQDMVEDRDTNKINVSVSYLQELVALGTLSESVQVNNQWVSSPTEDTRDMQFSFTTELAGTPSSLTDYSVKYSLDYSDLINNLDPTASSDTQSDDFDISLTLTPNDSLTLDTSFNWSVERVDGAQTVSAKNLKIEGNLTGDFLDVPNLTFTPALTLAEEKNLVIGTDSNVQDLDLKFLYSWTLPRNMTWELDSTYTLSNSNSQLSRGLDFESGMELVVVDITWLLSLEETSSIDISFDDEEDPEWTHEFSVDVSRDLTYHIMLDSTYSYSFDDGSDNTDSLEISLDYGYRSFSLSLGFNRERTFEEASEISRKFILDMSMTF
jgi:hypothetical protein